MDDLTNESHYRQSPYLQFGATPAQDSDPESKERFAQALTALETITAHFAEFGPWEEKTSRDLLDELNHFNGWAQAEGTLPEGEEVTLAELQALSHRRLQALEESGENQVQNAPLIRFLHQLTEQALTAEAELTETATRQTLAVNTVEAYASEFKRILNDFSHNRHIRELFTDWLEIAACTMHNAPYQFGLPKDEAFEQVEACYMDAIQKYDRKELDAFAKLLGLTQMALQTAKGDFLGKLYMELEVSQNRSGEFFTPYPLSLMTANMMLGDAAELIKEQGYITVSDPACGAGGMLIAAAQIVEAAGYDPGKVMFFDATDISKACCDMAYIQTSILGMSGIVRHGNSLSQETWNERLTPTYRIILAQARQHQSDQPTLDATATDQTAANAPPEPPTVPDAAEVTPEPPAATEHAPKPASDELINLANETDGYEQGRLF